MFWNKKPYKVKVHGRAGLTYQESDKEVFIDSEMLVGEHDIGIWLDSVKHWSDGSEVSSDDLKRIKSNLILAFKGTKIDWY